MTDKNIVVYTAVFGGYDIVSQPKVTPKNVDFVCFTDDPETVHGVWETRIINDYDVSDKLMSGQLKTLPHRLFPEYDYSLWVDGNVRITGNVRELIGDFLQDSKIAVPFHPKRDCLYAEAEACIERGKAESDTIRAQIRRYREAGYPKKNGLSETRVLLRRHNEADVINTMEVWWDEYREGAERDQLCFEYAAWKQNINYTQFILDYDTSNYFELYTHSVQTGLCGVIWRFLFGIATNRSGIVNKIFKLIMSAIYLYSSRGVVALLEQFFKKLKPW